MRTVLRLMLRPDLRRPVAAWEIPLRPVVLAGMAGWALTLLVSATLSLTGVEAAHRWVWTAVAGLLLGLLALRWTLSVQPRGALSRPGSRPRRPDHGVSSDSLPEP